MKPKAFICDLDDTLADFIGTLTYNFNKLTGKGLQAHHWSKYHMEGVDVIGKHGERFLFDEVYAIMRLMEQSGFYAYLPALPGAQDFVEILNRSGIRVIIVTARPPEYAHDTMYNVIYNNFQVRATNILFSKNKAETITKLAEEYDIIGFVDDAAHHVNNVAKNTKVQAYCLPKAHNLNEKVLKRVKRMELWEILADLKKRGVINGY